MNSTFESQKKYQASNIKLESNINTLKSNLYKSNTSLRKLFANKLKSDKFLGVQIIRKKNYGLSYAFRETNHINTQRNSLMPKETKHFIEKVIKQGERHQGFGFAKMYQHQCQLSVHQNQLHNHHL